MKDRQGCKPHVSCKIDYLVLTNCYFYDFIEKKTLYRVTKMLSKLNQVTEVLLETLLIFVSV